MSIIYECDRCGARGKDRMPTITLAINDGSGFSLPQDLATKAPMLCQRCANDLSIRLHESLPRSA